MTDITILRGIVGSTAYGLNREGSDVDRLGCYIAPTEEFLGLHPPVGKKATEVQHEPGDMTEHEVGKLVSLLLTCNPTVTELLWLSEYEIATPDGRALISLRDNFSHARGVRNAYLGYATQQFRRLNERADGSFSSDTRKRTEKHARHLKRLCHQGYTFYKTGQLPIHVENPHEYFDFGEAVANDSHVAESMITWYETLFDRTESALPHQPNEEAVNQWLIDTRRKYL